MNEETPERNQEMSEIKRYRKKPVVIEAVQWDGTSGGANTVIDWIEGNEGCARYRCAPDGCTGTEEGHYVAIETLEGTMSADAGDFIIRGVQGEFYPCKPEIFEKTYEAVDQLSDVYDIDQKDVKKSVEDSAVPRLTEEQAAIMMAFTGISCGPFELFHKYTQEKLDRPLFTHEFAEEELMAEIQEASMDDFLSICCLKKYDNE